MSFKSFNSIVQNLKESILSLLTFESANQINTRSDDIEGEILLTTDSLIERVKEIEAELLHEVRTNRTELLLANLTSSDNQANRSSIQHLSTQVIQLENRATVSTTITSEDASLFTDANIDSLIKQAKELESEIASAKLQMQEDTFKKRFISFTANDMFSITRDLIGRIHYSPFEYRATKSIEYSVGTLVFTQEEMLRWKFLDAIYLQNDRIACISSDGVFWCLSKTNGKSPPTKIFSYKFPSWVTGMIEIPGSLILVSHLNGSTSFVDTETNTVSDSGWNIKNIFWMKVCPKGRTVTVSTDGTIRKWDPVFRSYQSITNHGCVEFFCKFGMLPNGYVLACCDNQGMIKVWDLDRGELVKQKPVQLERTSALAVLSTNQIVIASKNGSLKVVSLADNSDDKIIIHKKENDYTDFIEVLPDDRIVISSKSIKQFNLQIWDLASRQLVQTIMTDYLARITSCHLNSTKTLIAATSYHGDLTAWRIYRKTNFSEYQNQTIVNN